MERRRFVTTAIAAGAGLGIAGAQLLPKHAFLKDRRQKKSRVAVVSAAGYSDRLDELVLEALRLFRLDIKGKSVLLKPNLVEHAPGSAINTHPIVVGAAANAFLRLGACRVVVGEGPGHERDTYLVLVETGLEEQLRTRKLRFVDLNRDELIKRRTCVRYTGFEHLWLPQTVLQADFIVSMPKVKTHHWAGVTLSMKNMFGVIPGVAYGWPKNVLHWRGIHESILDICSTVPIHFVIADGIVAMEGNGPLHGSHRQLGKLILADDPVAADFTCCRLMGLRSEKVPHLATAAHWLGNGDASRIDQLGEALPARVRPFAVLPEFTGLVDI
jgi:uncharacterized protein (DUF362 family)